MRAKTTETWELMAGIDGDITSASVYYNAMSGQCRVNLIDRWSSPFYFDTLGAAIKFAKHECGAA
jgi:hypothetical protein